MLSLNAGASSIVVAPELGGGLTGWIVGRTPVLRRALPQATVGGDRHALGCFPLLPYGNRIGGARFRWSGVDYALQRNFGDAPHTIHGLGWQRGWTVETSTTRSVTLRLRHDPDPTWPFAFDAEVGYNLSETALTVTIRITSRHPVPAPAGIGVHPFFPKVDAASLRFDATGVWENDAGALPLRHGPPQPGWLHRRPRFIRDSRLDNCFTGWNGSADIQAGPAGLRIEASFVFRQLQVFTPSWADFFCVEPVSHVPDAVNRPDLPPEQAMHILQPNDTLSGTVSFILTG
ncbi:MAG TPA: aldose 1-epimerase [Rhodopila sp.]|jgi:aldose 1-epimerase